MIKRIIFGILLFLILWSSFIFNFFPLILIIILVLGCYELLKNISKKPNWIIFYTVLFIIALLCGLKLFYYNKWFLFFMLLCIISTDSFAFFVGKFFGKHHFSKVSPNKTIEGLIGGIVCTVLVMSIFYFMFRQNLNFLFNTPFYYYVLLCVGTSILAILGDLLESKLKRELSIKDTSNILKQHGGIVDRVDSWILVLPCLFILINL